MYIITLCICIKLFIIIICKLLLYSIKLDKLDIYKLLSIVYLLNEPMDEKMLTFALDSLILQNYEMKK